MLVGLPDPFLRMGARSPSNRATPHGWDQRFRSKREWPDASGPVQGSLARDEKVPVIQPQLLHEKVLARRTDGLVPGGLGQGSAGIHISVQSVSLLPRSPSRLVSGIPATVPKLSLSYMLLSGLSLQNM